MTHLAGATFIHLTKLWSTDTRRYVCGVRVCVGHMAARCPVEQRPSPQRKKLHVRSKTMSLSDSPLVQSETEVLEMPTTL